MVGQTGTKKRNRDVEKSEIHKHLLSDHLKVNNLTYKKKEEKDQMELQPMNACGRHNLSQLLNKSS